MSDTTTSPIVYIGSHLKAEAFGGMNGDPNPSSLLPGQTVKRGSVGKALMKGTDETLAAIAAHGVNDKTQSAAPTYRGVDSSDQRTVSASPLAPARTMHDPNTPKLSGTVPANDRKPTGSRRTNDGPIKAFKG